MSGQLRGAVQSSLVPSCAPATEYVAMPEGSSSAAPVIMPGPSDFKSNRTHLVEEEGVTVGVVRLDLELTLPPGRVFKQCPRHAVDRYVLPAMKRADVRTTQYGRCRAGSEKRMRSLRESATGG